MQARLGDDTADASQTTTPTDRPTTTEARLRADVAKLTSDLATARAEAVKAKADLIAAESSVEERASLKAQQILAGCGAGAVSFKNTSAKPASSHKQAGGVTGLARVVQATRDNVRQVLGDQA
jgi:hypothetical protein